MRTKARSAAEKELEGHEPRPGAALDRMVLGEVQLGRVAEAEVPADVLDIIQGSDIEPERKDLIVDREIARLEEKIMQLRVAKETRYVER